MAQVQVPHPQELFGSSHLPQFSQQRQHSELDIGIQLEFQHHDTDDFSFRRRQIP
jgi:hypothetical protein